MQKISLQILIVVVLASSVLAQMEKAKPVLLTEFGRENLESIVSQLDYFVSELSNKPETKGLVRIYGGSEDCFACHYGRGSLIIAYLKNTRKISSDSYSIQYCTDRKEELRSQLYLMPPLTKLPECEANLTVPKQSVLFDSVSFDSGKSKLLPFENDYIDVIESADGEYSQKAWNAVKNLIDKSPESRIYVMVYLGANIETGYREKDGESFESSRTTIDKKSMAESMLSNAKKELVKNGFNYSQIKTIKGGYRKGKRELEFWFVPKNGEIPKPKPN